MKNRKIKSSGIWIFRSLCACFFPFICQAEDSPNIVFIMVDQMTADGMSCAGNQYVNTPNLDRLAERGVRFIRSYVTQPLSSPSRSSLQTGRYPHEIGVVKNSGSIIKNTSFLGKCVKKRNYKTAYFGKWHVQGISITEAGYDEGNTNTLDRETTKSAVSYINKQKDKPFFLTVSYTNPHDVCELARHDKLHQGNIANFLRT